MFYYFPGRQPLLGQLELVRKRVLLVGVGVVVIVGMLLVLFLCSSSAFILTIFDERSPKIANNALLLLFFGLRALVGEIPREWQRV